MADDRADDKVSLTGATAVDKARALLANFQSAMLVTRDDHDALHVRPLALLSDVTQFNGSLSFFTDDRSSKVREAANGPVLLIFQSDHDSAYLELSGHAAVEHDPARRKALYTPFVKAWFPDGLDDPHLVLFRFEADRGAYWESPGGRLQALASFVKALATHTPGKGGDAGTLTL
jgi:general stress protein 26